MLRIAGGASTCRSERDRGCEMARVAIIMPTWNGERFVERAIRSVLEQSCADLRLIVVDDGSTDSTPDILRAIAAADPRLLTIRREQASGGPSVPKNIGLLHADAPYVAFIDHDDFLHRDRIGLLADALDQHRDWVAAFHDLQPVDQDGVPHSDSYLGSPPFVEVASAYLQPLGDDWYECNPRFYQFMSLRFAAMHTDTVMLARDRLVHDPVGFRARFRGCDDTDLWLRVGLQGKIGYLNRVLAYCRKHDRNLSADTIAMNHNALGVHADNYLRCAEHMSGVMRRQYRAKIRAYRRVLAYQLRQARRYSEASLVQQSILSSGDVLYGLREMVKSSVAAMLRAKD